MRLSQLSPMLRALLLTLFLVIFALVFLISANNSQNRAGLQKYEVTLTALASIAQNQVFAIGTLEFELSKTPTPTFTATPTPTHTPTITPIPTDTPTSTPTPSPTTIPINICDSLVSSNPAPDQSCKIELVSVELPLGQEIKVGQPVFQTWEISNPNGCNIGSVNSIPLNPGTNEFSGSPSINYNAISPFVSASIRGQDDPGKYYGCWQIQGSGNSYSDLLPVVIDVIP